jgi:hypothetical protein
MLEWTEGRVDVSAPLSASILSGRSISIDFFWTLKVLKWTLILLVLTFGR